MADESKLNERDAANASLGQGGRVWVDDTTATTPPTGYFFHVVEVVEAATFSLLTDATATGDETSQEFPVGDKIFGEITAFTLSGGKVRAYLSKLPS